MNWAMLTQVTEQEDWGKKVLASSMGKLMERWEE